MLDYENHKILLVGFGYVARCTLPILMDHIKIPAENITIIDFNPNVTEAVKPFVDKGVHFFLEKVEKDNLDALFNKYLSAGDLLLDLAWNIDCCTILQWCHDHHVLYLNTSVELWDPYENAQGCHPSQQTLYWRHMNIRKMTSGWSSTETECTTAVLEHGANPGLISHFVKQGLMDIAAKCIEEKVFPEARLEKIAEFASTRAFNFLAKELEVKVIHCSERDTQISDKPKEVGEFVNTWSIEGFREEGTTTAELGWGTHEKELPALAFEHSEGPKSQICLARMGINTHVTSWVPGHNIVGMLVRHGEAVSIPESLTVVDDSTGEAVYRPTMHYAYCPCDAAIASLQELRGENYVLQSRERIMTDEIVSGSDILGALIMGHPFNSWWCGSDLSIEQSRLLAPHQNATTVQVAISAVAACMWMIENPNRGVNVPDNLPHDYILDICKPYLGTFISTPSDWTPLKNRVSASAFNGFNKPVLDYSDPWQFKNFLKCDNDW